MIKSKVEQNIPEFTYPWIGKSTSTDEIVLFIKDRTGTRISGGFSVGFYSSDWNMENFKYIPKLKVTLENE